MSIDVGGGWHAASPAAVRPTASTAGSTIRSPRRRIPPRSDICPSCPSPSSLCTEGALLLLAAVRSRRPPVGQVEVGAGLQLVVGGLLDGDHGVVGRGRGPEELVELALG